MRRYGVRSIGNLRDEHTTDCIAEVASWNGWNRFQCSRKRGHGPGGLYCKQHARMIADGKLVSAPKEAADAT